MAHTIRLDPDQREILATAHKSIASVHADIRKLIADGVEGLEWVDACLIDAGSDVAGIFNNTEPMSFRQ
ncbi:hypothetical protein TSH7_25095 [Azospirillum sp. TSH7]|uniref:hypothetical protein n=1 Tax=unclassified Azospirillum TaxID=2630922 RepID=UPI000D61A59C|nr:MULTISPECIES: hypothetical protein [unclassified Azospirillum]PWC57825.1 hypothetical protein TSH7_25095 [Azospirillum sp. TSH7]PWC70244.1 hypothetical protein TSH20_07135 [Azospirillum sp. TSH20]